MTHRLIDVTKEEVDQFILLHPEHDVDMSQAFKSNFYDKPCYCILVEYIKHNEPLAGAISVEDGPDFATGFASDKKGTPIATYRFNFPYSIYNVDAKKFSELLV